MKITPISSREKTQLLAVKDLTTVSSHCVSLIVEQILEALKRMHPNTEIVVLSGEKIVNAQHNYTLLGYDENNVTQSSVYTKWIDNTHILRTQTTSLILEYLLKWRGNPKDVIVVAPGMVYRRDVRDRWHCAQPHQIDIWHLTKNKCSVDNLTKAVNHLAQSTINQPLEILATSHPYTENGIELNTLWEQQMLEIGEAGLISRQLLERLGVPPVWGGWAMGWGLDRLVMVRKKLPDIRLLRDALPAIESQMNNLDLWKPVSRQPSAKRQISIVRNQETEEQLVESILQCIPQYQMWLQNVQIVGRWPIQELPSTAIHKLGPTAMDQENILIDLIWQSESTSLERSVVNNIVHNLYKKLHLGTAWTYLPTEN